MKGKLILGLLIIIITINGCTPVPELSEGQIEEIIKPDIIGYCDQLNQLPEITSCPKCWSYGNQQMWDEIDYAITKENDGYHVSFPLRVIYGRNTHNAYPAMNFILDETGSIISKELEEKTCLE
jgi:hypothetical protein